MPLDRTKQHNKYKEIEKNSYSHSHKVVIYNLGPVNCLVLVIIKISDYLVWFGLFIRMTSTLAFNHFHIKRTIFIWATFLIYGPIARTIGVIFSFTKKR